MTYFNEVRCQSGCVLSVDKLVLNLDFAPGYIHDSKQTYDDYFLTYLQLQKTFEMKTWKSQKIGSYDMNFSIQTSTEDSFWFGLGFNGGSDGFWKTKARLEFNPNKVAFSPVFINFWNKLLSLIKTPEIKRFDLAVDYPMERRNAHLIKDRRTYKEIRNSYDDRTQYLGTHNNHGFCKLYNKALEQRLSYPLTRLEITLDYGHSCFTDLQLVFPVVRYFDSVQLKFDNFETDEKTAISDTDRFILYAALENPDNLGMLPYRKRKKIEKLLDGYSQTVSIDYRDYNKLMNRMNIFRSRIPIPQEFLNCHGELSEQYKPDWVAQVVRMDESDVMY